MRLRSLLGAVAVALTLAAACSDGGEGDGDGAELVEGGADAEALRFEGDADSAFCQVSRAAADEPVLDPFEAGLDPEEVEQRFRALAQRFGRFADVAPDALEDDLALLNESFAELAALLEEVDYDFAELATTEVDISLFDDPAFTEVAERLAAYQEQVCER